MKRVKIDTDYFKDADYLMLENMDDLAVYSATLQEGLDSVITRLMKSKVPVDRWDHMFDRKDPDGIMIAAWLYAKYKGTNPIFEAGPIIDSKINTMRRCILNGDGILINSVGGYCTFDEKYHTIASEKSSEGFEKEDTYVINENTKYINLENDPDLEQHTIDYLNKVDPNYSYVCNLRNYSIDDLIVIFKEFQKNGGEVVYVYTTGMDTAQMWEYSEAIIRSGIKRVEFEFNAGMETAHKEIIAYLQGACVVQVL